MPMIEHHFPCEDYEIHFVFSFLMLGPDDVPRNFKQLWDEFEPASGDEDSEEPSKPNPLGEWLTPGKPDCRKGIMPHFLVPAPCFRQQLDPWTGEVAGIPLNVEPLLRLFPLGGTCTLRVVPGSEAAKRLEPDQIHRLLQLVQQTQVAPTEPDASFSCGERSAASLYEVQAKCVDELLERINSVTGEDKYRWEARVWQEMMDPAPPEMQSPYLVTVLKVPDAVAAEFLDSRAEDPDPLEAKRCMQQKYQPYVASLLFRSVTGMDYSLEWGFLQQHLHADSRTMLNSHLDSRLFVVPSTRSTLILCRDLEHDPYLYFAPVLFDTVEIVRARWHALIGLNWALDRHLRNFRPEVADSIYGKLQGIMRLRSGLISCLEDPGTYVCGGDALADLHEWYLKEAKTTRLEALLTEKVQMLERLYRDLREWAWLSREQRA